MSTNDLSFYEALHARDARVARLREEADALAPLVEQTAADDAPPTSAALAQLLELALAVTREDDGICPGCGRHQSGADLVTVRRQTHGPGCESVMLAEALRRRKETTNGHSSPGPTR